MSSTLQIETTGQTTLIPTNQTELFQYIANNPSSIALQVELDRQPTPWDTTQSNSDQELQLARTVQRVVSYLEQGADIEVNSASATTIEPTVGVDRTLSMLTQLVESPTQLLGYITLKALSQMLADPRNSSLTGNINRELTPEEMEKIYNFATDIVDAHYVGGKRHIEWIHPHEVALLEVLEQLAAKAISNEKRGGETSRGYKRVFNESLRSIENGLRYITFNRSSSSNGLDRTAYALKQFVCTLPKYSLEMAKTINELPTEYKAYIFFDSPFFYEAVEMHQGKAFRDGWAQALKAFKFEDGDKLAILLGKITAHFGANRNSPGIEAIFKLCHDLQSD